MKQMKKVMLALILAIGFMCVGCNSENSEINETDKETTSIKATETVAESSTCVSETKETKVSSESETKETKVPTENEQMYKEILDKYYQTLSVAEFGFWYAEDFEARGLCYLCAYNEDISEIGYTFIDVDKNGKDELFIGETSSLGAYVGTFLDMYTVVDDKIVLVARSGERDRYYLCENYEIENEASGGAALNVMAAYKFVGTKKLQLIEAVIFDGYKDEENPWFYTTSENEDDCYNNPISEKEAHEIFDKYEPINISYKSFSEYK